MLRVAQGQGGLAQTQLVQVSTEMHRAIAQQAIAFAVVGGLKFDLDPLGLHRLLGQAGQLMQPASDDRVDHKAVVGVIWADGVEAQPSALGVLVKARLPPVVGAVQRFKARQRACGLAYGGRLRGGDTGESSLAQTAELAHAQAQGRVARELYGGVAQTHIAGYR